MKNNVLLPVSICLFSLILAGCGNPHAAIIAQDDATDVTLSHQDGDFEFENHLTLGFRSQFKTPKAYVTAYSQALSLRTGVKARAFLEAHIQDQINRGPIGTTPWVKKCNVSLLSRKSNQYVYEIKAYKPLSGEKLGWVFTVVATVTRDKYGAWIISNQSVTCVKGLSLKNHTTT